MVLQEAHCQYPAKKRHIECFISSLYAELFIELLER